MAKVTIVKKNSQLKEIFNSEGIALVDFWSPLCIPCRIMEPTIKELAGKFDGEVDFFKVNVLRHIGLAGKYEVRGLPTLMIFRHGKPVKRLVGFKTKKEIEKALIGVLDTIATE